MYRHLWNYNISRTRHRAGNQTMNDRAPGHEYRQRIVVVMCDGLGIDYYRASPMPTLKSWAEGGVFAEVEAVLPTVTNANNASICCGAWPSAHGVVGNSYLDALSGEEEYLE